MFDTGDKLAFNDEPTKAVYEVEKVSDDLYKLRILGRKLTDYATGRYSEKEICNFAHLFKKAKITNSIIRQNSIIADF